MFPTIHGIVSQGQGAGDVDPPTDPGTYEAAILMEMFPISDPLDTSTLNNAYLRVEVPEDTWLWGFLIPGVGHGANVTGKVWKVGVTASPLANVECQVVGTNTRCILTEAVKLEASSAYFIGFHHTAGSSMSVTRYEMQQAVTSFAVDHAFHYNNASPGAYPNASLPLTPHLQPIITYSMPTAGAAYNRLRLIINPTSNIGYRSTQEVRYLDGAGNNFALVGNTPTSNFGAPAQAFDDSVVSGNGCTTSATTAGPGWIMASWESLQKLHSWEMGGYITNTSREARSPSAATLIGSRDAGGTWEIVDIRTGLSGWGSVGTMKAFELPAE